MSEDNIIPITPKKLDIDIQEYFTSLGYSVTWDCRKSVSEEWYELYDEEHELVAQIDTGVPLDYVVEDLIEFHKGSNKGIERPDKPNYKVSGYGPKFDAFLKKVNDNPPKKKD